MFDGAFILKIAQMYSIVGASKTHVFFSNQTKLGSNKTESISRPYAARKSLSCYGLLVAV